MSLKKYHVQNDILQSVKGCVLSDYFFGRISYHGIHIWDSLHSEQPLAFSNDALEFFFLQSVQPDGFENYNSGQTIFDKFRVQNSFFQSKQPGGYQNYIFGL